MSIISRILNLNKQADAYTRSAEERQALTEMREQLNAPAYKVPLQAFGVRFHEEGAETGFANAEVIDLGLKLPASRIGWELRDGTYRLQIRTDSPGTLSAYRLDGTPIFSNKRFLQYAVVDLDVGAVQLVCSEPILHLSLVRLTERSRGDVILGPFSEHDGIVSVRPIGHGSWTATVAHDSLIEGYWSGGQFIAASSPPTILTDTRAGYAPRSAAGLYPLQEEELSGIPWSIAQRFLNTAPRLSWTSELAVGLVAGTPESVQYGFTHEQDRGQNLLWTGVGEWTNFSAAETPSMMTPRGKWTYVWGRVTVEAPALLTAAYDMTTGRRVTEEQAASVLGFYLIEVIAADDTERADLVTVEGSHGSCGSALVASSHPTQLLNPTHPAVQIVSEGREAIPPGSYTKVPISCHNRGFLIRVQGSGILRAVEITVRKNIDSPGATEQIETFRESLAEYWNVQDMPRNRIATTSGRGLYLPHV